jgi:aminoglycoside phosphotransferase (APT) family kinase protein
VPANTNPPVLVHGDFNIHNMLADGDDITACLDWEWGHPGDPLEDLNNVRIHVEKYSNWDRFIQHYLAHGGPRVNFDDKVLSYQRCLTNGIFAAASNRSAWNIAGGHVSDLASVFGANSYAFEFHRFALAASFERHQQ